MSLKHGELFAGISGFGLGFNQAGLDTIWAVEIDPNCRKILKYHHPDMLILEDVRECGVHNLPPVDVISFGSPCQDLSVAGKRKGLNGERSGFFYEAIRIIRELNPTFSVWENVPGALSSNGGRDFGAALDALAESGAMDIGWSILDAQWFGLAQRRKRIFVVADFRGRRAAQILSIPYGGAWDSAPRREAGAGTPAYAIQRAQTSSNGWGIDEEVTHTIDISGADAVMIAANNFGERDIATALSTKNQRIDGDTETFVIAPTLPAHSPRNNIEDMPLIAFDWQSGGDVRLNFSSTHTSALQANQVPAVGVRRLTPVECERLQGFPDGWTNEPPQSDSVRYRQLGNAVAVPVAEWIGRRIVQADG